MLASPAKRRKTSLTSTLPISIGASERTLTSDASQSQTEPDRALNAPADEATPSRSQKRSSFQSPTKASLARYNPKLIRETAPRPITRSQPRPRTSAGDSIRRLTRSTGEDETRTNTSLVQQVLGGRRRSRAQEADEEPDVYSTPSDSQQDIFNTRARTGVRPEPESFSAAIARTFDAIQPAAPSSQRKPLRPRQASGPLPTPENSQDVPDKAKGAQASNPQASSNLSRAPPAQNMSSELPDYDDIFGLFSHAIPRGASPDAEPELPPTPIQLGISTRPERPRGLESLSSGSRRRRFREGGTGKTSSLKQRNGDEEVGTSSPLKRRSKVLPENEEARPEKLARQTPRDASPGLTRAHTPSVEHGVLASAAAQLEEARSDSTLDSETVKQRETLVALKKQLGRLESNFAQLIALVEDKDPDLEDKSSEENDQPLDPYLLSLLTSSNLSCDPLYDNDSTQPHPPPKPLCEEILDTLKSSISIPASTNPLPFLTLFTPGNLRLSTSTRTVMHDKRIHQLHTLELSAPPPFPAHVFGATVEVLADAEEEAVKSITVKRLGRGIPKALPKLGKGKGKQKPRSEHAETTWQKTSFGRWIANRLQPGSLHAVDVGALIWGIGRWWDAAVERAKLWCRAHRATWSPQSGVLGDESEDEKDSVATVAELLTHLQREGMVIPIPVRSMQKTEPDFEVCLHLRYTLELDWTGEVGRHIGLSVMGVDGKTEKGVKEVFEMLRRRKKIGRDGLVRSEKVGDGEEGWRTVWDAIQGVVGLLRGDGER